MKFEATALSDVGRNRRNNEDNLYFKHSWRKPNETAAPYKERMLGENRRTLFAVCDGMGGEALGEQASYIAVSGLKVLENRFNNVSGQSFPKLMDHYLTRTNDTICQYIQDNAGLRMGSTVTSLLLGHHVAQVVNIGDSMAFLYRDGELHPLTQKHTHVQRLLDMNIITPEEALLHPERHRLTQHLGLFPEEKNLEPSVSPEIWMKAGDIYMLCSDGITEMLDINQIEDHLSRDADINEVATDIMNDALDSGGKDNATLILIRITEASPIDPGVHPDAVADPPFILSTMTHAERTQAIGLRSFSMPKKDNAEDDDVKKDKSENEAGLNADRNIAANVVREPESIRPVPGAGGNFADTRPRTEAPAAQAQHLRSQAQAADVKRVTDLTEEDKERFRQAQAEAASRQRARKVAAAPIKVSSAYEEEQAWLAQEQSRRAGKKRFNWSGLVKNLIFFAIFIAVGYGAAWLLVNFSNIRSFFQNLIS